MKLSKFRMSGLMASASVALAVVLGAGLIAGTGMVASANAPAGCHSIPVGSHSLPVGCQSQPVGCHSIPIGNHFLPVGCQSQPVGCHSIPIGNHFLPVGCQSQPVGCHSIPIGNHFLPVGCQSQPVGCHSIPIGNHFLPVGCQSNPSAATPSQSATTRSPPAAYRRSTAGPGRRTVVRFRPPQGRRPTRRTRSRQAARSDWRWQRATARGARLPTMALAARSIGNTPRRNG